MVRLKIHIGQRSPLDIDLAPGTYTLGADEGNTIVVNLPGIALRQLEIKVSETMQVHVRNLSDLDELKVDGKSVTRSFVGPGSIAISGPVVLMVELLSEGLGVSGQVGKDHPGTAAKAVTVGYVRELLAAFRYPMSNDSLFTLAGIGLVMLVSGLFSGVIGLVGTLISIFIGIYVLLLFSEIIKVTIQGEDEMPTDTGFSYDWESLREFVVPLYAMVLLPSLPLALVRYWPDAPAWLPSVLAGFAVVYIPMGLLIMTVTDNFWAAHPFNIAISVWRAPFGYACVAVFLLPLVGLSEITGFEPESIRSMNRFLLSLLSSIFYIVGVYMAFVWARMLGVFYRHYRHQLRWEE